MPWRRSCPKYAYSPSSRSSGMSRRRSRTAVAARTIRPSRAHAATPARRLIERGVTDIGAVDSAGRCGARDDLSMNGHPPPLTGRSVDMRIGLRDALPNRVDVGQLDLPVDVHRNLGVKISKRPLSLFLHARRVRSEGIEVADDEPIGERPASKVLTGHTAPHLQVGMKPERKIAVRDEHPVPRLGRGTEIGDETGDGARDIVGDLVEVLERRGAEVAVEQVGAVDEQEHGAGSHREESMLLPQSTEYSRLEECEH